MSVPMRTDVRRQDRPGHVGEAAGEERRGQLDDMMRRLKLGDVMRFLLSADFTEVDGSLHPVLFVMHGLCHRKDLRHIQIARAQQQIVVAAQPPEQATEDGKPVGITMQDDGLREFDEFGRDVESTAC